MSLGYCCLTWRRTQTCFLTLHDTQVHRTALICFFTCIFSLFYSRRYILYWFCQWIHCQVWARLLHLQLCCATRWGLLIWYDMIWYMIWYDTFVNCNWVATRWQQYGTHLHKNNIQNDTKQTIHRTTQKFWKSAGHAPSLRVLLWHLPYNWGKSTEKPQSG